MRDTDADLMEMVLLSMLLGAVRGMEELTRLEEVLYKTVFAPREEKENAHENVG